MAQNIILKRSATSGKVPTTSSLNIGELAINTYDGKIFLNRSGSSQSIQEIITTNATNTGSITLTRTGSFGELVVTQDANIQRDLYVVRDIITNGSLDISGSITGSSLLIENNAKVNGNLTVLGEINARQFNIGVISSSIMYTSGSNKFGDTQDDTHQFTGSVSITGSFLLNGSPVGGTTSGSFTGSFTGDGSGLRGVVSDDLPIDGWDYNSNSSASISEFNNESRKYIIDFEREQEVGTPIGFKTFISNVTGSSQIVPTEAGIKFIVGNQQVALIGPNGIQSVPPLGTVSGSSQLTSSYDSRYVLSGSITQTTWDNIASKPSGIVSGSAQTIANLPMGTISGSSQITYANISSIPSGIVSGSSQITISSTTGFTTYSSSVDSRIATEKGRVDAILLASDADKDSFAEIVSLINSVDTSNDSTFASFYTASVGRLNNLESTSASVNTSISNLNTYTASISTASLVTSITNLNTTTASLNTSVSNLNTFSGSSLTRLSALEVETSNLESFSSSALSRLSALEVETSNLESFTSSINTTIKTRLNAETIVSGSSQVIGILSSLNTYTGSNDTTNTAQNARLTTIESVTGSYETRGRGIVSGSSQITFSGISSLPTLVSGSSQVDVMSTTNIARLATTGSNTFNGNQTLSATTNLTDSTATGNGDKTASIIANKSGVGYHNLSIGAFQHTFLVGGSQVTGMNINTTGTITPGANGTQDLGSTSLRWGTIYTSDLSLNNGIGDWTIVEGEDDLFLYNNKKGKVYKFALTEVDANVATPKKS